MKAIPVISRTLLTACIAQTAIAAEISALINSEKAGYELVDATPVDSFLGQAIRVTGQAGYASIPSTAIERQQSSFSMEAFIKMESPGTGSGIIAVRRGATAQDWQWWCSKKGEVAFQAFRSASGIAGTVVSKTQLELDRWYHVAVSVTSDKRAAIYIDGDKDNQETLAEPMNTTSSSAIPIYVAGSGIDERIFPGLVVDYRYYPGEITNDRLAEVKAIVLKITKESDR